MKIGQTKTRPTELELVVPVTVRTPVVELIRINLIEDSININGVSETLIHIKMTRPITLCICEYACVLISHLISN